MYKKILLAGIAALAISCNQKEKPEGTISVDFSQKGADVPESMYGIFFEEINHAGDGGLYAELVQNRGFEETWIPNGFTVEEGRLIPPKGVRNHLTGIHHEHHYRWPDTDTPAWSLSGNGTMKLTRNNPLHPATPASLELTVPASGKVTLSNSGYWGMNFVEGDEYDLRFYARKGAYPGAVTVRLVSEDGKTLVEQKVELTGNGWQEYKLPLKPTGSSMKGNLAFDFEGGGKLYLDYVSLFPRKTFMNRPNGLRNDVATILAELKPAFVRWPGGCVVEGITLDNRIRWKETIGDPMTRPGNYDTWGYRTTMGFGYHEFLQFCEDTNAKGMFVCNAGIGCQGRMGDACSEEELQFFIDDALDAIEYALGDVNTKWGAKRAENGHAKPFPLEYVEIGNENWGAVYTARYDRFYKAIKAKYPQLTLISTLGLGGEKEHQQVDMIDPHWYVAPDFFFMNTEMFDNLPRPGHTVYVGEYACNTAVGGGNFLAALSEAAFLTGMERNSDLVTMASYAPLLENVNDRNWPVNLIWLDSHRVMGRSSYHVQKMFAENRPDYNIDVDLKQPSLPVDASGYVGLGTWNTEAEFKDFRMTHADGRVVEADLSAAGSEWKVRNGNWSVKDGMYTQTEIRDACWSIWEKERFDKGTIEFKARKISGHEGFILYFGVNNDSGYAVNIGGWNNQRTAIGTMNNAGVAGQSQSEIPQRIETDRWYDFKLTVDDSVFTYYCDGQELVKMEVSRNRRYSIAGYDARTDELVIKVVNAEAKPFTTAIDLNGVSVANNGKVITLSSASELDENDLDHPDRIIPKESVYNGFGPDFQYTFEPWSFTILRVPVK